MLGLFGIVGGAALEIRRLRQRGQPGGGSAQDAQSLGQMKKELEEFAKQLEAERRGSQAANARASGLEAKAEALAQQNTELLMSKLALDEAAEKLQREANELVLTNRRLAHQVEELTATRDADAAQFESDLAALRDRVAAVLQRMFGSEIDEAAALEELRELGCEVRFVPEARRRWGAGRNNSSSGSGAASFTIEPRLLLDDPAKMTRLMQAARSQSGGSSPRLLTSASGGLTPRMDRMQAALTIGGPGCSGPSPAGGPRFVLSWLGTGAGAAAGPSPAQPAAAMQQDAVRDGASDAASKGVAAALGAPAAAPARSPIKAAAPPVAQDGALVFSTEPKGKAGHKSRLSKGLSLTDAAAAVFKKGGNSSAAAGAAPHVRFELPGDTARADSDVGSGSRDLVTRG